MKKDYGKIFKGLVETEGYKLLSEYKNNNIKVKLNCPKGHLWDVVPKNFKRGIRCPKCSNKCPIQAKEQFDLLVKQEGYKLLSGYKGALKKVKIKCPKGHEYKVTPNDFKSGYRCPKCSGKCPIQAKEQFIELLEKEGYELLSEYKNVMTKVKIRCNKSHEYKVIPDSYKRGCRCAKCVGQCPIQAKEQFLKLVEQEGYKLLSEYKKALEKVKIRCPEGHEYKVRPNDFKSGSRCSRCVGKCPIQAKEQFLELLEKEGYELLSEYKNTGTKVKIRCNKGHIYKVTPDSYKQGSRCPKCSNKCPEQAKEQFMELLKQEGYELLGEYKNTQIKVKLSCPSGHEWNVRPSEFRHNYARCPHCIGSTGQRLLQKMLESYNLGKVIYNDREALSGLELDIYYPDLNIGIEYQGNYWHNRQEAKERDKRKKLLCKEKGIKLIEVWDDDFMKDVDIILNKILKQIL